MARKRQIAYWCFLLALLFIAVLAGSVGQTQSRRVNAVVWNTFAEPSADVVTSDCLQSVSDVPLTVLLGEMNQINQRTAAVTEIPFVLESDKGLSGKLTWSVEHPDYLNVKMSIGSTQVQQGGMIGLSPDVPVTVVMTLTATEKALSEEREALTVHVNVNWSDMLKGTFQVILPAVTVEEAPGDDTTVGDDVIGGDDITDGDDTTGGDDIIDGDDTTGEDDTTDSDDTTGDDITDGDDATTGDDTIVEENPDDDTEQTQTNNDAETVVLNIAEQESVQIVNTGTIVEMETLQAFSPATTLPIKITTGEQVDRVQLGIAPAAEGQTQLEGFPRYTRFSLDNGESYYMLYHDDIMEWNPTPGEQLVLVDFSDVELGASLNLMVNACSRETQLGSYGVSTAPTIDQIYQMNTRILTESGTLQIQLTPMWKDYPFSYEVHKLVAETAEDGEEYKTYVEVNPEDESLLIELDSQQEGTTLTVRTGEPLPEPGTYKVSMRWMYEDICFGQTEATFFVNYSTELETDDEQTDEQQAETEQTGGAE